MTKMHFYNKIDKKDKMMAGDELDRFVSSILETKQLSGMDDDVHAQLIDDLKQQLLDQINRALIDALPEEKLDQFNALLEDESVSDDEIQQFILNSGLDTQKIAAKTMLRFRDLYLESTEERA